jgi:hypothetical protein
VHNCLLAGQRIHGVADSDLLIESPTPYDGIFISPDDRVCTALSSQQHTLLTREGRAQEVKRFLSNFLLIRRQQNVVGAEALPDVDTVIIKLLADTASDRTTIV